MKNMPPYLEEIRLVDMGPLLGPAYRAFEQDITRRVVAALADGGSAPLLPWLKALLVYADMPWLGWTCRARSGEVLGSAPALPAHTIYPLEQALIDYVSEQVWSAGAPTLVFTENTGTFDDQDRLQALVEQHARGPAYSVPHVAVLHSAVPRFERQDWIESCAQDEVQVLVCTPYLLLGLDLTYFKRIAFKRVPTQLETLQRSARCLYTPTQEAAVQTAFFAYQGSMALRLLSHHARRLLGRLPLATGSQVGLSEVQRDESLFEISSAILEAMQHEPGVPQNAC